MWKSCSKCGKLHKAGYKCRVQLHRIAKTEDQKLRSTSRWQKKSQEIRKRSKYLCAVCLQENRYNYEDLEVHHIEKLKDKPEKLLDDLNLICLCKYHHELADAGKIEASYLKKLAEDREGEKVPPTLSD